MQSAQFSRQNTLLQVGVCMATVPSMQCATTAMAAILICSIGFGHTSANNRKCNSMQVQLQAMAQVHSKQCKSRQCNPRQCKPNQCKCDSRQNNATQCYSMQGNAMQCNARQFNARQCKAMQGNARQCNIMQGNAMQCNSKCNTCSSSFRSLPITISPHDGFRIVGTLSMARLHLYEHYM